MRQPKPRFTVDVGSQRGTFRSVHIRHYRILFDGSDHGIRAWDNTHGEDMIEMPNRCIVVPTGTSAVRWLNEQFDLANLPPLLTEQFEMEI